MPSSKEFSSPRDRACISFGCIASRLFIAEPLWKLFICMYIYIYTHIYFLLDHYVKCIYFCRLSSKILKATGLCSNSPLIASIFLSYRDEGHSPCSFFRLISWLVNLFIYLAAPGLSCGTWDLCSLVVACRIFSCGMQYLFP